MTDHALMYALLAVAGAVLIGAVVFQGYRLWQHLWAHVPLAQLAPMAEVHEVLHQLQADERQRLLLQGWLTRPQWHQLRDRALAVEAQRALHNIRPGRNDAPASP